MMMQAGEYGFVLVGSRIFISKGIEKIYLSQEELAKVLDDYWNRNFDGKGLDSETITISPFGVWNKKNIDLLHKLLGQEDIHYNINHGSMNKFNKVEQVEIIIYKVTQNNEDKITEIITDIIEIIFPGGKSISRRGYK